MPRKSVEQVAGVLRDIYGLNFGGKVRGRYRISYEKLKGIAGRKKLNPKFVTELAEELFELNFVLVDLGPDFAVVEQGLMRRYRKAPQNLIQRFTEEEDEGGGGGGGDHKEEDEDTE